MLSIWNKRFCQYHQLRHEPVSVRNAITKLELRVGLVKGKSEFGCYVWESKECCVVAHWYFVAISYWGQVKGNHRIFLYGDLLVKSGIGSNRTIEVLRMTANWYLIQLTKVLVNDNSKKKKPLKLSLSLKVNPIPHNILSWALTYIHHQVS